MDINTVHGKKEAEGRPHMSPELAAPNRDRTI
jgi:hypothetical protein